MRTAAETAAAFRSAVAAKDPDAVVALAAEDVVFHGPISDHMRFTGRAQLRELFGVLLTGVDEARYVADLGDGDVRVLILHGRRGRVHYEEAVELHVDARGDLRELRSYVRPLPGMVAMAASFAPALARARGQHVRALVLVVLLAPLKALLLLGEPLGARLLKR